MPEDLSTRVEAELRQLARSDTELEFVRTPELDGVSR